MLKNKKIIWGLIGAVAVIAIGWLAIPQLQGLAGAKTAPVTTVNLAQRIKASGPLEAQSSADLVWKIGGTVKAVRVQVGDHVKAGDILLSLDATSAPANVIAAQADLVSAKLALDNVRKSGLALAQAKQALANALKAVDDAQKDVTKLDYRRASDDLIKQTQDEIDLAKKAVSRAEDYFKLVKYRPEGDSIRAEAELRLINARTYRDNRITLMNWYRGTPNAIDAAKYRAALAVAQAQQADAEREVDRLKDGPTADDIAAAQARVDAAQAGVDMLSIIAPANGEVLAIEQHAGDVVTAGTLAISVADRSRLHVQAQVDETDIAGIAPGDPVEISLDAMPEATLRGKVTFINPVGQTISGLIKYLVRVDLEPVKTPMLLGATADVVIQVGGARDTLAVPFTAVRSDKNGEYVTVVDADGSTRQVPVQSGAAVDDLVIVRGDLKAGERVEVK